MSHIRNAVYYTPPQGDFKQTLGYGIARYGLFSYISSDRVHSNLTPYVKSNLPSHLRNLTATYASQKKRAQKRGIKKKIITHFFQMFPSMAQSTQQASKFMTNPFSTMQDFADGKVPWKRELSQDSSWGTATVKTNSLQTDLLWSTTVNLGSSLQPLRINIDTGSADFIVSDPNCTTCNSAFLYQNSDTFSANINTAFNEVYADGSVVNGYLAMDDVNFGNGVQVHQAFGLATEVSSSWVTPGIDGLMGLGPDSLSTFPPPYNQGVFTQLLANQVLLQPVIGIALVKSALNSSGEFTFGKVDESWIRGGSSQLLWKNVTSQNFWGTELSGIFVNDKNIMVSGDPTRAIVDTGTSLLLVSTSAAAAIHAQIPGAAMDTSNGIWRLPCQTGAPANGFNPNKSMAHDVGSLFGNMFKVKPKNRNFARFFQQIPGSGTASPRAAPNIFIELGAGLPKFGIPASDLPYQGIPKDDPNSRGSDGKTVMCYSGIQSGADGFFVLGGTFIKNQYIALRRDGTAKSMGFGNRTDVPVIH